MLRIKNHKIDPEIFNIPLFSMHLKGMRMYGYLIGTNQGYQLWHFFRCSFLTFSFALSCYLIFVKVSRDFDKLDVDATSRATAFLYLSTALTMMNAYLQRKRVVNIVNFIHKDLKFLRSSSDDLENQLLGNASKYCRGITTVLLVPSCIAGSLACADCFYRTIFHPETVFNMPQILNGTAQPIMLFQVFPFREVYDNFVIGYFGPSFAITLAMTSVPLWHTFVTCLMKYVIVKFEIINKRLRDMDLTKINPRLQSQKDIDRLDEMEKNYWRLKMCEFCVKEQIKIRWLVKEVQQLIGIPVFLDFIIFSVVFCFLFYALTTSHSYSKMDYFFTFLYLFVIATILWLYHWHGTLVSESNNDMRFAIYCCDWYNYPVNVQKSIRLIMMESSTPLIIRAVFVELKLSTFIDAVRGAYSYFSILRNANVN